MKFVERKIDLVVDSQEEQQDPLILSWIFTALSPSILSQVASIAQHIHIGVGIASSTICVCI